MNETNNLINNIWIINLDKSTDRMEKIKKNFDSLGVKYNRFSAVYGKNVSKDYLDNNVSFICKKLLCNYGTIGCAASHKTLWKQLINSDREYYIVFEDDIEINKTTIDIINKLEPFIKKFDIDYLNLSCVNYGCSIKKTEFTVDEFEFGKPYFPLQTGSYIITKKGAIKLLNNISKTNYHVDFEILFVKFFEDFNYYTSVPPIVRLTGDDTTIGLKRNTITLKILQLINLEYVAWFLNAPLLTINLFYEINILMILLLLLFLINKFTIGSQIILWFVILELVLVNLIYF